MQGTSRRYRGERNVNTTEYKLHIDSRVFVIRIPDDRAWVLIDMCNMSEHEVYTDKDAAAFMDELNQYLMEPHEGPWEVHFLTALEKYVRRAYMEGDM